MTRALEPPLIRRASELLLRRTGFLLDERLTQRLVRALELELHTKRHASANALLRQLETTPLDGTLWRSLISHIAIGETYFFRDAAQMSALRQHILPGLITEHNGDRRLAIWSIGCASGEEPYSIAIILADVLDDPAGWNIEIIGSDLNDAAIQRARRGLYRPWSFRHAKPEILERYFTKEGTLYRLNPQIRKMVQWRHINLANPAFEAPFANGRQPNLILCRNVLIYMDPKVADAAAQRLEELLKPGGWLLVAAAELGAARFAGVEAVQLEGTTAYRKSLRTASENTRRNAPKGEAPRHKLAQPHSPPLTRQLWAADTPRALHEPHHGRMTPTTPLQEPSPSDCARALSLLRAGQREEAIRLLTSRAAGGAEAPAATAILALIAADAKDLEEAARLAHRAIELDPFQPAAYYVLGTVAFNQQALKEAVLNLRRTLYLDPRFVAAHLVLAVIADKSGQPRTALRHRHLARELLLKMRPDEPVPGHLRLSASEMLATLSAPAG